MSGKMTKDAYARLIQEDIDWLRKQPACLEREHIEAALRYSIKLHYPEPAPPPPQREGGEGMTPRQKHTLEMAVDALVDDLTDRQGISDAWYGIEIEIRDEIKAAWVGLIAEYVYPEPAPPLAEPGE